MFKKKKNEPKVIFVINSETKEQVVYYGWITDEDDDSFVVCDARTSVVCNHEFDKATYEWKYPKRALFPKKIKK